VADFDEKMSSDKHQFHLGLDYVISREGRIYLLEMNLLPGDLNDDRSVDSWQEKSHLFDSRVSSFCSAITPKLNQHEVFGNLMPAYEPDKRKMEDFAQGRRVIYKGDMGRGGDSVSMTEDPRKLGRAYFVEEYIEPRCETVERVEYPYILREYVMITTTDKKGIVGWKSKNVYRKRSREAEGHPKSFILNTDSGSAQGADASVEDIITVREFTGYVMEIINNTGRAVNWNPSLYFLRMPLVEFFPGLSTSPIILPNVEKPEEIGVGSKIQELLKKKHRLDSFCHNATLPVKVALRLARLGGWSGIFIPTSYNEGGWSNFSSMSRREVYEIQERNGSIILLRTKDCYRKDNTKILQERKYDTLYVVSEDSSLNDIVASIAERWKALRAA